MEQLYTEEKVIQLIRDAITATTEGVWQWVKDETDIVDKKTQKVIKTSELKLKPERKSLMENYVFPRLKEKGIVFELEPSTEPSTTNL